MRRSGLLPSLIVSVLMIGSAGLPGLGAIVASQPEMSLMALTELKAGSMGHYTARATINKADIEVMVDTGASVVALSYEDAQKAGLRPNTLDFKIAVSTANGTVMAARATLDRVEIDTVRVDNVDALVLPEGALNGTLLGMSFLSKLSGFRSENGILTLKN